MNSPQSTSFLIIGIVNHLIDTFMPGVKSTQIKHDLLTAIQADSLDKILQNPDIGESVDTAFKLYSKDDKQELVYSKLIEYFSQNPLPGGQVERIMRGSAKSVLTEFITQLNLDDKDKLLSVIEQVLS